MPLELSYIVRNLPVFLNGLLITVELSLLAIVISLGWGLVIAVLRNARARPMRWSVSAYIELVRDTPLLIQILFIYFGFSMGGFRISGFSASLLALSLQHGAYMAEIYRAGLQSISQTQIEGGKALGMRPHQVFSVVVLPQAIARIVPPLSSQFIVIIKDTSLASAVSVTEITLVGKLLTERTAASYEIFFTMALLYLLITSLAGGLMRLLEQRLAIVQ